jgi:hypothetical protein
LLAKRPDWSAEDDPRQSNPEPTATPRRGRSRKQRKRHKKKIASLADLIAQGQSAVSVPEAGHCFGLGRNASYKAAKDGEIPTMNFGKLKKVSVLWIKSKLEAGR